ncbi:SDR family oxidoreductase [Pseudothermotoga thermarum]|uniref:Short-chain dehydrogenase/reductase SDR n=1 Tax=Pseudothermotoga thermarum DSM 5069 TaxID=688269 RepID=F7YYW8_9THEM|nr:SDR family oxidoreductase [Pseudothermotoga thermarum]AEH51162.1 short-chain dehydrogenase/reductase SDR [Pseudothermotoga thermarum DSM 5069]
MRSILEMFSLEGKVVVITGGAGVLGSAIGKGMGKCGAKIAICDIKNAEAVAEDMRKEGIDAKGYYMDVLNLDSIKATHDEIIKDFGKVDVLLNAAGGNIKEATTSPELSFFDLPFDALQKVVNLNLFGGAILPCQVFGKTIAKNPEGGSIINISSMAAYRPLTRVVGYSAAKAAVSNFTQWLAVYFALEYNKKVRVNAIAPGFFLTHQNRYLLVDENGNLTPRGKAIIDHTPMGRFGDPDDLIGVCIWLASDASKFVTGAVIPIDGGFNAYSGV